MKRKLLIATRNPGKLFELSSFLSDLPLAIVSLSDLSLTEDIEETGKTYKENSQRKALFFTKASNLSTIADDGGLEIDALGGAPGVRSRRWLGHEASDEELIAHMQKLARELPVRNRSATFRTVVSFALPNGEVWSAEGKVKGIIAEKPYVRKFKGYPFRSFFFLPSLNKYYFETELTKEEQRKYNHRWKAVEQLKPIMKKELGIRN